MRLALITPHYQPETRGNAVTVRRIERYLKLLGHAVDIISLDSASMDENIASAVSGKYDLYHSFHASKGGIFAWKISDLTEKPYIITLTGTDVCETFSDHPQKETALALEGASRITAFHSSMADLVKKKISPSRQNRHHSSGGSTAGGRFFIHYRR